jgi:serine/threonine protein kinase/tetratricopeptide (TPR) repeat protein
MASQSHDKMNQVASAKADLEVSGVAAANLVSRNVNTMGRYHILRVLGEGGMGCVYEAYDPELNRKLAIKVLRDQMLAAADPARVVEIRTRLVREAKNLAKLAHPNVVPIYDVGIVDNESVFLAMEFVPGMDLAAWLAQEKPSWKAALAVVLQAGEGLAAAHAAGILHRDIKPANLLLGNDGLTRVLDFGLAKARSDEKVPSETNATRSDHGNRSQKSQVEYSQNSMDDVTQAGTFLGTPAYLPPEILEGARFNEAADIFAFGSVLFEALTLMRPFPTKSVEARLVAIQRGRLPWRRGIPSWLRRLVEESLRYNCEARSPSIRYLLDCIYAKQRAAKRRRNLGLAATVVAVPIGVFATYASPPDVQEIVDHACREDAAHALDSLFAPEKLEVIKSGFEASQLAFADELWTRAKHDLLAWRSRWDEAHLQLCPERRMAAGQEPFEPGAREQSRACLEEEKSEVETLLEIWRKPTTQQVLESSAALSTLSAPEVCTKVESLKERIALPIDPDERRLFLDLQGSLKGIGKRIEMVDYEGAERELEESRLAVGASQQPALYATWSWNRGLLDCNSSDSSPTCIANLRKSLVWSIVADLPRANADSNVELWQNLVYRRTIREESEEILSAMHAAIVRSGSPPQLVASLYQKRAISQAMDGNFERARDYLEKGIATLGPRTADNIRRIAKFLEDLSLVSDFLGDLGEAVAMRRKSDAIYLQLFPPGHPIRTKSRAWLALTLARAGRFQEGHDENYYARIECLQAEVPSSMCLEPIRLLPAAEFDLGFLVRAIESASWVKDSEDEFHRRLNAFEPSVSSVIEPFLSSRGELSSALYSAKQGLKKLDLESGVRSNARFWALKALISSQISIGDCKSKEFKSQLEEMRRIANIPSEESKEIESAYHHTLANLERKTHHPERALAEFEDAYAISYSPKASASSYISYHLDLANALFDLRYFEMAHDHAQIALELHLGIEGLLPHRRVIFHETLAKIAYARQAYGDALLQLEQAYLCFDPVEVLDNRLAALHFLEAQVWWAIEHSKSGREHARNLAQRALAEYEDWDGGADEHIRDVRAWLRIHRV